MLGIIVALTHDLHALIALIAGQEGRDPALERLRHAGQHGPVDLARVAMTEGLGEFLRRLACARNQNDAGRFLVEPVHQARLVALAVRKGFQHAVQMTLQPGAALDRQTCRLVQDHHLIVFKQQHVLDGLAVIGNQLGRFRPGVFLVIRRQFDTERRNADHLALGDAGVGFSTLAIDAHLAGAQQLLQAAESRAPDNGP